MTFFADISRFDVVSDYLPILNGAIITDLIIVFLAFYPGIFGRQLARWYTKQGLSAFMGDVLILVIGAIVARALQKKVQGPDAEWSLTRFIVLALGVQIAHDFLFQGLFSSVPRGVNKMLDVFKDQAVEASVNAVAGDSLMMILTILFGSALASTTTNTNIIVLVVSLYIAPFLLHSKL